jgi:hypothetical protein
MKMKNYISYLESFKKRRMGLKTICKNTRRKGEVGEGFRKSLTDKAIPCVVLGSFSCLGGGGYFVRRLDTNNIIQVQSFKSY